MMTLDDVLAEAELCSMAYAQRHGVERHERDCFDVERDVRRHLAVTAFDAGLDAGYRRGYEDAAADVGEHMAAMLAALGDREGAGDGQR